MLHGKTDNSLKWIHTKATPVSVLEVINKCLFTFIKSNGNQANIYAVVTIVLLSTTNSTTKQVYQEKKQLWEP